MGKRLTKDELLFRLNNGDLKNDFDYFLDDNDFIDVVYDIDAWGIVFKCKHCGVTYIRSINKMKRHQQCPDKDCKVRRCKHSKFINHGDENYNNIEQMKATKMELYGDTFGNRAKINNSKQFTNKSWTDRMVSTKRLRYGDTLCSDIDKSVIKWKETRSGDLSSMSKQETDAYYLLTSKFDNVHYNYYDKVRYPYLCDFYIEDIDTFIELNYHWSHGTEPYIGTKDQMSTVRYWIKKGWYHNIKVWTVKDVNKRSTAKNNGLNYLEFFSPKDFNKWINSI